ncbi:MAG: hypothetical protein QM682_03755 [Paracoccus sp. (in: a-proteobacteria)]
MKSNSFKMALKRALIEERQRLKGANGVLEEEPKAKSSDMKGSA